MLLSTYILIIIPLFLLSNTLSLISLVYIYTYTHPYL